jgi:hypothetical protein
MRRHRAGQTGAFTNQRETFEPAAARRQDWRALLASVGPALAGIGSVIVADVFQQMLFSVSTTTRSLSFSLFGYSAR